MKRTLCIILMLPLLFAAMGQTLDVRDIVVDTENDGTLKYDYYYSPDGQLSTEQESQLVGGEYIPRRRVVRNYISGTNNSLCESHEDFVNGEWILSDMVTLSYQQDRLSKAVQTFADGETREYSMSYDRKGRIVMQTLTTTKNSETSTISQSWFYSANGNLGYISFAVTYSDGSKQSYRLRIVTNDTDKTVYQLEDLENEATWTPNMRFTLNLDPATGKDISQLVEVWTRTARGFEWVAYQNGTSQYDGVNLTNEIFSMWSNMYWTPQLQRQWNYDSENRLASVVLEKPIYQQWKTWVDKQITYSDDTYRVVNTPSFWAEDYINHYALPCAFVSDNYFTTKYGKSMQVNYGTRQYITDGLNDTDPFDINVWVYPNPSDGLFFVSLNKGKINYKLNIYSLNGELVQTIATSSSYNVIDLTDMPSGIYALQVVSGNSTRFVKLIKQ